MQLTRNQGDEAYALMGLLRRRPSVESTDTEFQALARLSLANDNDMLLERLMCIMPRQPGQPWWSTKDQYRVKLWDIYPTCQIAGVCKDDTVLIDGAFGTTIRWDKFRKVGNARRAITWKRLACQLILHGGPYLLLVGVLVLVMSLNVKSLLASIGTGFNDINQAYTRIDGVYGNVSADLDKFASIISSEASTLLPRDAVSDISSIATEVASAVESFESSAKSALAAAISSEYAKVVSDTAKVVSHVVSDVVSQVSAVANDILAEDPVIPSSVTKGGKDLRHAKAWAIFGEAIGIFLIVLAVSVFLSAPFLTRTLYRGKFCEYHLLRIVVVLG